MARANKVLKEYKVRKILLGMSLIIFFGTLPYLLLDIESKLSIVNVIIDKIIKNSNEVKLQRSNFLKNLPWIKFYINLALTILGLIFYYFSNFSKYLGSTLSKMIFSSLSHNNNKYITKGMSIIKALVYFGFLAILYGLIISLVEAYQPPIFSFNLFMLAFFVVLILWDTGYPDFETLQTKPLDKQDYDFRNELKLVKLKSNQLAYVKKGSIDEWNLSLPEQDVNMSYSKVYVYDINQFTHNISDLKLLNTVCGKVMATCEIGLDIYEFPNKLETKQRQFLEMIYGPNKIPEFISTAIQEDNLKDTIEKIFLKRKRFNILDSENPELGADNSYEQISDKLPLSEYDSIFTGQIYESLKKILSNELAIKKVKITIIENTIKDTFKELDEEYKQLKEKERNKVDVRNTEQRRNDNEIIKILVSGLSDRIKSPATSWVEIENIRGIIQKLESDPTPLNVKEGFRLLNTNVETPKKTNDNNNLNKESKLIGATIYTCKINEYSKEDMIEKISICTNFFDQNGISIDNFLDFIFPELEMEEAQRAEEEYTELAKRHLIKLMKANG